MRLFVRVCARLCEALKFHGLNNDKYLLIHVKGSCRNKKNVYLLSALSSVFCQEERDGKLIRQFM